MTMEPEVDVPPVALATSGKRAHLAWLDSVRALAALWVVAHHAWFTVGFTPTGRLQSLASAFLASGHYAVTTFIALSGYSLALQASRSGWCLRNGYGEFVASRAIRIVPPYYASILLSLFLIATVIGTKTGTHWDVSIPVTAGDVVKHLLLIQNFDGAGKINHAYWSISIECQIYLFFGLFLLGLRRYGLPGLLGTALGTLLFSKILYTTLAHLLPETLSLDRSLLVYFPVFACGIAACWLSINRPETGERRGPALLLAVAALLGAIVFVSRFAQALGGLPRDFFFGFGASVGLYALATHADLRHVASNRVLATIGAFAYSIYLVHAPLLQVVYNLGGQWKPQGSFGASLSFLLVALPFCLLCAYAFHLVCERPFFKMRHHLLRRGNAGASSA